MNEHQPTEQSKVSDESSHHALATGVGTAGGGVAGAAIGHSIAGKAGAAVGGVEAS